MNRWPRLTLVLLAGICTSAWADDADPGLFAEEQKPTEAVEATEAEAEEPAEAAEEPEEPAEPTIDELQERARALNQEMQRLQNELRQRGRQPNRNRAGAADLEDIVLPENPTRAECEAYVEALSEATQGQNSFSSNDPQVAKLAQIPAEHVDLLLAQTGGRSPLRFHAQYAMRGMDFSGLRDRIGALVEEQPAMIGIVVTQGWCQDARQAIANKLNQRPANLGLAWFQAAAELNDPALYDALHDCAAQTRYTQQVVMILEGMSGYDLERTVSEMWRNSQQGNASHTVYQVAVVAVRYGHIEALQALVNQLNQRSGYYNNNGENTYDQQRTMVMRYIDFSGSNAEIAQWLTDHKDELVFDHVTQRYLLPSQIEQF